MAKINDSVFCDGCGVEIEIAPVVVNHLIYCCKDCSDGLACKCGERMEMEESRRAAAGDFGITEIGYS